jgi:MoaA/NifB/PqqE/SkfB family radical SAM enzyme
MIPLNNEVFCMAPWCHLNVSPNGEIRPCCSIPISDQEKYQPQSLDELANSIQENYIFETILGSLEKSSLKEVWNNDTMKELRRNMINGQKSEFCSGCYKVEENGTSFNKHSLRQAMNSALSHHYKYVEETKEDGTFERFNLVSWNFELSNVCNFKCRSCAPGLSSSWEQELKKNFKIKNQYSKIDIEKFYQEIEPLYEIVEDIHFAGCEPLICDYHYEILTKLIEKNRTNVHLFYNTNFSILEHKGMNILDLWEKFPNIEIQFSLDGIGKRGELIRKGFDYQKFLYNIKLFKERFPQHNVTINYVFQALNCFHTIDVHKELYEKKIITNLDDFSMSILYYPDILSVSILDFESKKKLREKIKHHILTYLQPLKAKRSIYKYMVILKLLSTDQKDHLIPYFHKYMTELDTIRNENYLEIFPEFIEIFEEWKTSGYI